jgi:hypothetical protein
MRIIFICGSLEPGKDGVGDYVRRLAGQLNFKSQEAAIIAFSDQITEEIKEETQYDNNNAVSVLRLCCSIELKQRAAIAKTWINTFKPDWISLQYVPYSFHPKGLPFGLGIHLKQLAKKARWHIMFHELWLVSNSSIPTKHYLIGSLQKKLIAQLIKDLHPEVIHTQTQFSQHQLRKIGLQARLLPLFSNIPVMLPTQYHANSSNEKEIRIVSFGSIHPNSLIAQFAKEAASYQEKHNQQVTLTVIGRAGELQKEWISTWKAAGLKAEILGEQSPDQISKVLTSSSSGLSSTPYVMSEKSGSVAAMREHNIPVICIANTYIPKGFAFEPPDGIVEYSKNGFENSIEYKPVSNNIYNLSAIVEIFLNDLSGNV